jgi:hypothetical protein
MNVLSVDPGLDGKQFGAWTLIKIDATGKRGLCRCQCGAIHEVAVAALESGVCRSCGCAPLQARRATGASA